MSYEMQTPLMAEEKLVMSHMATYAKGYPRPMGTLILTNQRVLFEKKGGLNAATFGVLSLAMKNFDGIPLSEITSATAEKSISGAGLNITIRSGEEFKFALNGYGFSSKKKPRDEMINYINNETQKR